MILLYIFPHPDDESFGPSPAMYQQLQQGHEVHLLTLTRGGATKERHKLGLDITEMGDLRVQEMHAVNEVLGLTSMSILDLVDGGLTDMNPLELEEIVKEHILRTRANIVITYPQHGISNHFDHLTIHAVVKRLFCELRQSGEFPFLQRLAFFTLGEPEKEIGNPHARFSSKELIDCVVNLSSADIQVLQATLNCYKSYSEVIVKYDVVNHIGDKVHFELWNEHFNPPLNDLTGKLVV